jgi:tetratricopeptide (TPR) repeat protein
MVALLKELAELGQTSLAPDSQGEQVLPGVWNVPHPPNQYFQGREDDLRSLREGLRSGKAAVLAQTIHGEGGVGKTYVAVEYAYRHRTEYDVVWWLEAEDPAKLAADYAALAGHIEDLRSVADADQPAVTAAVRQWLSRNGRWLLVFDNAAGPEAVKGYIPQAGGGHVVVTSRNPAWGRMARTVSIDLWPGDDSVAFLLERTGSGDTVSADRIAKLLDNLPLALEHAGAYVEATGCSLSDYAALLEGVGLRVLDDAAVVPDHAPVSATWKVALARLENEGPEAYLLMRLLAFLAPEGLPVSVFRAGARVLHEPLRSALSAAEGSNRLIAELRRYGLIGRTGETVSVHRVLQHVVRDSLDQTMSRSATEEAAKLVSSLFRRDADDPKHWDACAMLVPHARIIADHALRTDAGLEEATSALNQSGIYLKARGAYAEAEPLYRRALAIGEKTLGSEHPDVATRLNNLAGLLRATGRSGEAELLFRRALAIGEKTLGPKHPKVATRLNNLAGLLRATGRSAEAEPLYRRALAIGEKTLGPEHPSVAIWLNNLAGLLEATGRYDEAEPLYRRAVAIGEKTLGPEHPNGATTLNNLAGLLEDTGRYAEAEPLYRRALAICEKTLGPEHPNTAIAYNNLAGLLYGTDRYDEAEPLYRRALAIGEKTLGPEHPDVATRLNNVAGLLRATGRYDEAEPLYRRALAIGEKTPGPEHPNVATTLDNLAGLLEATGRYDEAEPLYRRALAIGEKTLGPEHPNVAATLNNLAELLRATGRSGEAEALGRSREGPDQAS